MSRACVDPNHEGDNDLEMSDFYDHPNIKVCKKCHIRRSTAAVLRTRDARQAAGLPRTTPAHKPIARRPKRVDEIWLQNNRLEA